MTTAQPTPKGWFSIPYSLFPIPCLTVIWITVSRNSPLFGVHSNESNQLDRFFFACESVFFTKSGAKIRQSRQFL